MTTYIKPGKWDDFEPMDALIGGVLQQAVKDAQQTSNQKLHTEAWEFLEVCAPDVADHLKRKGAVPLWQHGMI